MSDITQMYMLTRGDHQSMDGFRIWQPGEWVRDETYFERINTGMLGAPYWYETVCYDDPLHAFLDGYKHKDVILWRGERRGASKKSGIIRLVTECRVIEPIPLPQISEENLLSAAIKCATLVCDEPRLKEWADGWVGGTNRNPKDAEWVAGGMRKIDYSISQLADAAADSITRGIEWGNKLAAQDAARWLMTAYYTHPGQSGAFDRELRLVIE